MLKPNNHLRGVLAKLKHKLSHSKKASSNILSSNPLTIPLVILALGITLTGYNLIKTIKSPNNQSASAEQLPGTPESGAKSRITELYDALVAQNKGSDTDISNLPAAQGDWGAKWNRIKTAALRGGGGSGGASNSMFELSNDPQVNFVDKATKKEWSYPLYREGYQVKVGVNDTKAIDVSDFKWSWDATHANNQFVGNKTATQLCQELGNNWRLPTKDELYYLSTTPSAVGNFAKHSNIQRWSSTEHEVSNLYAWSINIYDGTLNYNANHKRHAFLISCVRQVQ